MTRKMQGVRIAIVIVVAPRQGEEGEERKETMRETGHCDWVG